MFCPPGSSSGSCSSSREVTLAASSTASDTDEVVLWKVTGGRLNKGEGREVTWDLTGLPYGTYTVTVELNDGNQHTANSSTTVTVAPCSDCVTIESPCPTFSVSCPDSFDSKQSVTFEAHVYGGDPTITPTYQWSLSAGKIISGQGTAKVVIDISNMAEQSLTATVTFGGADPGCTANVASCTTQVSKPMLRHPK